MSVLSKIKLGLAVVVGVPIAGFAAYAGYDEYANGAGEFHVVAPLDTPVEVIIDSGESERVSPGGHRVFKVEQGTHAVKIIRDGETTTHEAKVDSGFYETLLPADGQCFAVLDVYDTYYQSNPEMPEVLETFDAQAPIEVGSTHYFSEDALPSQVKEGTTVKLVLSMPCKLRGASEKKLLEELGYDEKSLAAIER